MSHPAELSWRDRVPRIGACDTRSCRCAACWEKANLNWVGSWMALYGGSFIVLAAYVASTIVAAAARVFSDTQNI